MSSNVTDGSKSDRWPRGSEATKRREGVRTQGASHIANKRPESSSSNRFTGVRECATRKSQTETRTRAGASDILRHYVARVLFGSAFLFESRTFPLRLRS